MAVPAIRAKPFTTPPAYFVTNPTTRPPNAWNREWRNQKLQHPNVTNHRGRHLLTFKVTGINVYGVQPVNKPPDKIVFDSDENKALTMRKIMP